jgi:16S rRNA C1402 N4-methylase RsmH
MLRAKGAETITKNVIRPSREEILKNPRARSAKLRAIKKPL